MEDNNTQKTVFVIEKMDCPSEENLIRIKLNDLPDIEKLDFDIPNRTLTVYHTGAPALIEKLISELNLGEKCIATGPTASIPVHDDESNQKKLLWAVLGINLAFFFIEMAAGVIVKSMGLIADSLDMLADSFVYGISLLAVVGTIVSKKRVAQIAGYFQISLAIIGFVEVWRRFFGAGTPPDYKIIIIVSFFALIANSLCLYILNKSKNQEEAHMKASMIFTSNDVIINIGVIVAGLMVNWLNSNKPDLIIGAIVFVLVVQGAIRILRLAK